MPPTAIIDSLQQVRRKVKFFSVAIGVGMVVAAAVGVLAATILLDYCLNLPMYPRLVVMAAALGGLGAIAYRQIIKPVLSRLSISDVAGRLEHAFPQFDDRLRSTVDFVDGKVPGSQVMQDQVVRQAADVAREVDLNQALIMRPVVLSILGGLTAVVAAVVIASLSPHYTHIALARLFSPAHNNPWPKSIEIGKFTVPARVPVGQSINVQMTLNKGAEKSPRAILHYRYDDGPEIRTIMTRGTDGGFTATMDAKGTRMTVWTTAGGDMAEAKAITVVERLAIQHVEAVVNPPEYARTPETVASTINLNNGPAMVTVGSDVKLNITFNKPLKSDAAVAITAVDGKSKIPQVAWDRSANAQAQANWLARDSFRFHIKATDIDGFENSALEEFELSARPDQMPTVMIESPRRNIDRTPEAVIPVQALAEDDFGIKTMDLVVDRLQTAHSSTTQPADGHWVIHMPQWQKIDSSADRIRFRSNFDWELASTLKDGRGMPVQPGDILEYCVVVRDNFDLPDFDNPNGPHQTHEPVASGKLRILVISQEDADRTAMDALRNISEKVRTVQNQQNLAQQQTTTLQKETQPKEEFTKADKDAADRVMADQTTVASQTKQLAAAADNIKHELDENKSKNDDLKNLTQDVKDQLGNTAENPMKDAVNKLGQAKEQKADPKASSSQKQQQSEQRNQSLSDAQKSQQQASDDLQKVMDRMSSIATLPNEIKKWDDILKKQEKVGEETKDIAKGTLGKKPEELNKDQHDKLDKNAQEQRDLANEVAKATKDLEKSSEDLKKSDPAAAQAMQQAAQQSKSQGIPQKQQAAAQQSQQNQQSQAQSSQQQAEIGIKTVLDTLKEAELRKLAELKAKLEEKKEMIANLVRRQAGHNIDNLSIQGGDKIALISDELIVKSLRDKANMPAPPSAAQLTDSQQQTERNTRDVASQVSALPGGARCGSNLITAAGKMGYAISSLRDNKLPEAYDPHQTGALVALEDALKDIQELLDKAKEKLDQEKKEKLHDIYVQIRDDQQKKINDPTVKLAELIQAAGKLTREEEVHLNGLPGTQGEVADRTAKVGDMLKELDSIVYDWANKDIVKSMKEVKDDLAKPDTGAPTQIEEKRIVAQLDAMIDDLATKPKPKSKFEKEGSAGKGGSGNPPPPKMPTEAELRLLKSLQVAVNAADKALDAIAKDIREKAAMVSLGGRQGELRGLLNKIYVKAGAKEGLGAEPDPKEMLPEEATDEKIDDDELIGSLLHDKPAADPAEKSIKLVGARMSRSRDRLATAFDPGMTTQRIQDRIVKDLDVLIDMARQQQSNNPPPPPSNSPSKPGDQQQPANSQADGQGQQSKPNKSTTGAQESTASSADENAAKLSDEIKSTERMWGDNSPRNHEAVMEAQSEKAIERYRSFVEDYYRCLAVKATERK